MHSSSRTSTQLNQASHKYLSRQLGHRLGWQVLGADNALPFEVAPFVFQVHLYSNYSASHLALHLHITFYPDACSTSSSGCFLGC